MAKQLLSRIPAEEMDEAYITRLRRWRTLMWSLSSIVFASILVIELQSKFQSSVVYLFALAFTMLAVLFTSDLISTRIDIYESEKVWRKHDGGEEQ
jgi:uncharacterized membrane protein